MDSSQSRASRTGSSARKSSDRSPPRRAVISRSTAWMRGAFCSGQVAGDTASCTSSTGASRTASQVGKRSRSCRKARPESRFLVRWESSEDTSSLSGSSSWKKGMGHP